MELSTAAPYYDNTQILNCLAGRFTFPEVVELSHNIMITPRYSTGPFLVRSYWKLYVTLYNYTIIFCK